MSVAKSRWTGSVGSERCSCGYGDFFSYALCSVELLSVSSVGATESFVGLPINLLPIVRCYPG